MEQPTLFLQKNDDTKWVSFNRFSEFSNSSLWKKVKETSIHLFLREPALLELARRRDPRLLRFCEKMLISSDPDECFLAIQILVELGTKHAINRLFQFCITSRSAFKRAAICGIATIPTPDDIEYFTKLITPLACTGILNVTNWTPSAIQALEEICQRKSIRVVKEFHDIILDSDYVSSGVKHRREVEKEKIELQVLEKGAKSFRIRQ